VRLLLSQSPREETLLEDIIDGIDYAKDDKKIKALVLDFLAEGINLDGICYELKCI
jgi:hypothetical protein